MALVEWIPSPAAALLTSAGEICGEQPNLGHGTVGSSSAAVFVVFLASAGVPDKIARAGTAGPQ